MLFASDVENITWCTYTCQWISHTFFRKADNLDRLNGTPATRRVTKGLPMPDFTVRRFGTDTSGRPILMTQFMWDWWQGVVTELGFEPTIVQGAFMSRVGGGAAASAGYHDLGGCMDVRTWDLTGDQLDRLIRVTRTRAGASWRRDETAAHGGMDSHCHITLGSDQPLSDGARASWQSYLNGDNGLANNASDYEWRPKPLVTTPPERDWFDMATEADLRKIVREEIQAREDEIAAKAAKAVLAAPVIAKLDVNVRQALRDAVDEGRRKTKD